MRILVVDDEPSMRKAVKRALRHLGEVIVCENGQEALEKIQQEKFDLLITDNDMPIMKGLDLIKRSKEMFPDLPIILMSGRTIEELPENVVFLAKPFDQDGLLNVIGILMKKGAT